MLTDRRNFLKAASATPLAPLAGFAAESSTCGLGIGTYGLQSLSLIDAIRLVGVTGYDAIEITTFPEYTGSPEALKGKEKRLAIQKALEDQNLRLCALMADLHPDKDKTKHLAQLEQLKQLIELARDLSPETPPLIQTVLGGKNWEDSRELFRDRISDWIQIAADQRVTVSIKPHRSHAMSVPEEANWLIQQLGTPRRLKMVYDYSHYSFHEPLLTIKDTVATAFENTNYIAVKDAVERGGKIQFALAGSSGNVDHSEIIREFYTRGYRGDFCCEVSSQIWRNDPNYDPLAATKECFANMKAAFEKAGVARA